MVGPCCEEESSEEDLKCAEGGICGDKEGGCRAGSEDRFPQVGHEFGHGGWQLRDSTDFQQRNCMISEQQCSLGTTERRSVSFPSQAWDEIVGLYTAASYGTGLLLPC